MRKLLVALVAFSILSVSADAATTSHHKSYAKTHSKSRSKGKSFRGSKGQKRGYSKSKRKTGGSAKQLKTK
jgi:hypothetical protein